MTKEIKTIAVIGAGAMGSGIAAQAANGGYDVIMLDKFEGVADKALERMKKTPVNTPAATFMDSRNANRIRTGTIDGDSHLIAEADVIIEAVFETPEIKQATFKAIEEHARADAIITSNTSTLPITTLTEGMSDDFKKRFMNSHFFNPPRFMPLLELIDGAMTDPDMFAQMQEFGSKGLGKKVVHCKDTPGFIANRIGCYMISRAIHETVHGGFKIEDADAILSPAFGFPKMGVFKLSDFVGLDIMKDVGINFHEGLDETDEFQTIYNPDLIKDMVEDGYTGLKGKGGFYRVKKHENGKVIKDKAGKPVKEVIDLESGEYRKAEQSAFFKKNFAKMFKGYDKFFESDHDAAKLAWPVLRDTMLYVLNHAEEIAYDVQSIDEAMRTGYNWQYGPFELMDKFGVEWFTNKLAAEGIEAPALLQKADGQKFYRKTTDEYQVLGFDGNYQKLRREEGVLSLADVKLNNKPILKHESAQLWDIGDGVVCLEFTSPANAMDPSILYMINESVKLVNESNGEYKAMVIHNEGQHFSVGANLKLIDLFNKAADNKVTRMFGLSKFFTKIVDKFVEDLVYQGQSVFRAMRYAEFPVIGAPTGRFTPKAQPNFAFGGGCEVLLHCDAVQAGPDQVMGLVEAGVGLLPAWGGSARYLARSGDAAKIKGPMQALRNAAMTIADPINGTGANTQDCKKKLWLVSEHDGISMNADYVLADAKAKALMMAEDYQAPKMDTYHLPGAKGKAAINMNVDDMYLRHDDPNKGVNHIDVQICEAISDTLSGGEYITEADLDAGHVEGDVEAYRELIHSREDKRIGVNASMKLTEARLLQLERDNFYSLYKTPETKKRVGYMVSKNKPLREKWPETPPSPKEIRDNFTHYSLERKSHDGQPLDGADEKRLKDMAKTTARVLGAAKKFKLV